MENKLPSSVKTEQPEVCVGQEIHSWVPQSSYLSIQECPQKWTNDNIDMNVVKQELSDVCEDRSHSFSKMVDKDGGSIIQEMTDHSNSESTMVENSCKATVKHENCCQVSESVSSVIDANNELSLAIENCQQETKESQEQHSKSFAKFLDDVFACVFYSCQRTHTGDLSDIPSPNVCVGSYTRTHTEGMSNKYNEWDGIFIEDDNLKCLQNTNHKRIHTGEKPYKCDDCGAAFTQTDILKKHKSTHIGENPYKCDNCGASLSHAGHLKTHKRAHTGEKSYKCYDCGAYFTQATHLKIHKRIHTGEKPYKCDDCGASFTVVHALKIHKRIHTGEKPYKCDDCGASFTQVGRLQTHKRTHTGEKPYKCEVCGASFTRADNMKKHERTHTGEKPYKCEVCVASFTRTCNLKQHMRLYHHHVPCQLP